MLTKSQRDLMLFLQDTFDETGVMPSYDEMLPPAGLKSKSGIRSMLNCIEERGFIKTLSHRPRAIDIIRRVERTHAELEAREAQKHEAAL